MLPVKNEAWMCDSVETNLQSCVWGVETVGKMSVCVRGAEVIWKPVKFTR